MTPAALPEGLAAIAASHPVLDDRTCLRLLEAAHTPAHVQAHCRAVAERACAICSALAEADIQLDETAVRAAALLHDIARVLPDHAAEGAAWLYALGYPFTADIVRQHHSPDSLQINEAAVVYIADKLVRECTPVSIEARFSASNSKCKTAAARAMHQHRYEMARAIQIQINQFCGKDVIP